MKRASTILVLCVPLASLVSAPALASGGGPAGHRPKGSDKVARRAKIANKLTRRNAGLLGVLASSSSAVSLLRVKTSGGRRATAVRKALRGQPLRDIRACWKKHRTPAVTGRLDYELTLDKLGRVRGLSMRAHTLARSVARGKVGTKLPGLRACVERHLRAARFGAGPGAARVSLSLHFGSPFASIFGSSAPLSGGVGGLIGAKGTGYGGLGLRGTGRGGGGAGSGTIGLGRMGTIGRKGGAGSGSGYGSGSVRLGRRGRVPRIRAGASVVRGALDKEIIRRVIRRHFNQIRYCYQRELIKQPKLAGKVVVRFVIGTTGLVQSVKIQRSMGASGLEQCVIGRFKRMRFPSPKGGGIVIVTYPFNFSPSK